MCQSAVIRIETRAQQTLVGSGSASSEEEEHVDTFSTILRSPCLIRYGRDCCCPVEQLLEIKPHGAVLDPEVWHFLPAHAFNTLEIGFQSCPTVNWEYVGEELADALMDSVVGRSAYATTLGVGRPELSMGRCDKHRFEAAPLQMELKPADEAGMRLIEQSIDDWFGHLQARSGHSRAAGTIETSTVERVDAAAVGSVVPRILVLTGPPVASGLHGVMAVNRLLKVHPRVALMSCDPELPYNALPGCISISIVENHVLDWPLISGPVDPAVHTLGKVFVGGLKGDRKRRSFFVRTITNFLRRKEVVDAALRAYVGRGDRREKRRKELAEIMSLPEKWDQLEHDLNSELRDVVDKAAGPAARWLRRMGEPFLNKIRGLNMESWEVFMGPWGEMPLVVIGPEAATSPAEFQRQRELIEVVQPTMVFAGARPKEHVVHQENAENTARKRCRDPLLSSVRAERPTTELKTEMVRTLAGSGRGYLATLPLMDMSEIDSGLRGFPADIEVLDVPYFETTDGERALAAWQAFLCYWRPSWRFISSPEALSCCGWADILRGDSFVRKVTPRLQLTTHKYVSIGLVPDAKDPPLQSMVVRLTPKMEVLDQDGTRRRKFCYLMPEEVQFLFTDRMCLFLGIGDEVLGTGLISVRGGTHWNIDSRSYIDWSKVSAVAPLLGDLQWGPEDPALGDIDIVGRGRGGVIKQWSNGPVYDTRWRERYLTRIKLAAGRSANTSAAFDSIYRRPTWFVAKRKVRYFHNFNQ